MENKGTYVGAKFEEDTVNKLIEFTKQYNIPNAFFKDNYHTTIIYSKQNILNFITLGTLQKKWIGTPIAFDVFKTKNKTNALVLKYTCEEQNDRYNDIMNSTNATSDFPIYEIHVTLSKNIGDYNASLLKEMSMEDLMTKIGYLIIDKEYTELLKD